MKRIFTSLFVLFVSLFGLQNSSIAQGNLWDVQFNYDLAAATPVGQGTAGMAAVTFVNDEFWISKWASDTLIRMDKDGNWIESFTIAGLTGTRALTWDGTYLYASNNSPTIYRIDPATKTLAPPHITTTFQQVRMCTYDSTANNNAGGFWVSNFNTDINLFGMDGTFLRSIRATTHLQTGMYGGAIDYETGGATSLWIFSQSPPNNVTIAQIELTLGAPTGISRDAKIDVSANVSGQLAGGMFVSDQIVPGERTLGGVLQGTPNRLFGYTLAEPASLDYNMDGFKAAAGYTQVPMDHAGNMSFSASLSNTGLDPIATPRLVVEISSNGSVVWADSTDGSNLTTGNTVDLSVGGFTPAAMGDYTATGTFKTPGQMASSISGTDVGTFEFSVTDSTFARDDNISVGAPGYAVSSVDWGYATVNYDVAVNDTLSSVWIRIENPIDGDTTWAIVAATTNGAPNFVIAEGIPVIIQAGVNEYLLPISGGVELAPGTYGIGCYEGANTTINLSQSQNYVTQGVNFYYTPTAGWNQSGIQTARFIRPNFGQPRIYVGTNDLYSGEGISMFPNPVQDNLHFQFEFEEMQEVSVQITNSVGQVVRRENFGRLQAQVNTINLSDQTPGVYFVNFNVGGKYYSSRIVLTK
ncbi:MAG: T9SS type A sorting domain-containing protein [Saprospiraceae bacterium]